MDIYEIARGPLVWIAFAVFFGGALYKIVTMSLLARQEKSVFPTWSAKFGMRSILHWVVPYANRNTRMRPFFTAISFAFHICLLVTPLFVMGHAVLWEESWGISWWSLPPGIADAMTLIVIAGGVFFILRRIAAPEVRNVSDWSDFAIVLLVIAPFLTGFLAHQQWLPYKPMLIIHILTGCLWLIAIPFTRLAHMIWFFLSRSYMGSEFGAVRNSRDW
jgi:nitrate reductase gamma subunit